MSGFYFNMDKAFIQEVWQKSIEQYSASSEDKCLISISHQLQRATSPIPKFSWTHRFPSKIQIFLWKAFVEALRNLDNLILANSSYPRCNLNPKNATGTTIQYHVTLVSWHICPTVFDLTGITYHFVIAL